MNFTALEFVHRTSTVMSLDNVQLSDYRLGNAYGHFALGLGAVAGVGIR